MANFTNNQQSQSKKSKRNNQNSQSVQGGQNNKNLQPDQNGNPTDCHQQNKTNS